MWNFSFHSVCRREVFLYSYMGISVFIELFLAVDIADNDFLYMNRK